MISNNTIIKLMQLERKINTIDYKLDELLLLTRENEKKCDKMSSHIDFINSIYEKLRIPINYISEKFKLISNE